MKTKLKLFLSLGASLGIALMTPSVNAQQWSGNNNTTDIISRSGRVGIGNSDPAYSLDITGRARIRALGSSAGLWFNKADNTAVRGFVGMNGDNFIGLYGSDGIGWGLRMNVINGNLGLTTEPQTKLHMDLNGKAAVNKFDGIRMHYDKSESVVRADIGYDLSKDGFSIHSWAGGSGYTFADISFKTNGTTKLFIESNGNVGIGTTLTSGAKLTVNGLIKAEEIIVTDVGADYVFEEGYKLRSLQEVENYIKDHKHLPDVAPASETEKGIKVGEFNEMLLQKIEELTLYMIEMNKKVEVLEKENSLLLEQLNNNLIQD